MYKKITAAIAATVMITALFASLATVAGDHTASAKWKETKDTVLVSDTQLKVAGDTSMVLEVTVTNDGPDAVDNVEIVVPNAAWGPRLTIKVFKDNILDNLAPGGENVVTLQAGTIIEVPTVGAKALAGTEAIIKNGSEIRLRPESDNVDATLEDNLTAKIHKDHKNVVKGTTPSTDNLTFTMDSSDNASPVEDVVITDNNSTARLLKDTQVVRLANNVIRFPEKAEVELVNQTSADLTADNEIALENKLSETDDVDTINYPSDNIGRVFVSQESDVATDTTYTVESGDNVVLRAAGYEVIFPVGAELILTDTANVTLPENTHVIRAADENATMNSATATDAENQPNNWKQGNGANHPTVGGPYVWWKGIADNEIASGNSLQFPFALTSPSAGGDYTVYVRTTDTTGLTKQNEITLEVDATAPTIEKISASPSWAKDNVDVTITVEASEPLAKLDNVMVAENNAPENTQVTMSSTDNITWTGTYTTGDNTDRDGVATIYVENSQYEDLVGNTGGTGAATGTFNVDRVAPPTPKIDTPYISDWPQDAGTTGAAAKETNIADYFLENQADDNYADSIIDMDSGTVKIRVGTTEDTTTTSSTGYWSYDLSLTEGTQEVGVTFIDRAGNASDENVENITYDSTAPSISLDKISDTSFENNMYISDNTPKIELTISDAVVGVENIDFTAADNSGYLVTLENATGGDIDDLTNALVYDRHTLSFENVYEAGLADDKYRIRVLAGDNLQMDNLVFGFNVDTVAPPQPGYEIEEVGGTSTSPGETVKSASYALSGIGQEVGNTIKVYVRGSVAKTTTVASDKSWNVTVTLTAGKQPNKIEVSEVDEAGNESSKALYGYVMVDTTAPTVSITAPEDGTSTGEASVTLEGAVSDTVSSAADITVLVSAPGYSVPQTEVEPDSTGAYTVNVPLTEGSNTISVTAEDGVGNTSAAETITVKRTVTPWTMYAMIVAIVALILVAIAIIRREM